jgi:hypothetical protein
VTPTMPVTVTAAKPTRLGEVIFDIR